MKPPESLPLKEWYRLAEQLGFLAGRMIELGKAAESPPEKYRQKRHGRPPVSY